MDALLRILSVMDSLANEEIFWKEIKKSRIAFTKLQVKNQEDFIKGLKSFLPDIIISNTNSHPLDGLNFLLLRNELYPQTPFIFISDSGNVETAVEYMKCGADDYILSENIYQLGPAIIKSINKNSFSKHKKERETNFYEAKKKNSKPLY